MANQLGWVFSVFVLYYPDLSAMRRRMVVPVKTNLIVYHFAHDNFQFLSLVSFDTKDKTSGYNVVAQTDDIW